MLTLNTKGLFLTIFGDTTVVNKRARSNKLKKSIGPLYPLKTPRRVILHVA